MKLDTSHNREKQLQLLCRNMDWDSVISVFESDVIMEEDEGFIPEDLELRSVQDMLGCKDCQFSDKEKIGYEPCCLYPGKLQVIEGKCLNRRNE